MERQTFEGRIILTADENKIITDGKELYASKLYLGEGINEGELYEISLEEYNQIIEAQENEALEGLEV